MYADTPFSSLPRTLSRDHIYYYYLVFVAVDDENCQRRVHFFNSLLERAVTTTRTSSLTSPSLWTAVVMVATGTTALAATTARSPKHLSKVFRVQSGIASKRWGDVSWISILLFATPERQVRHEYIKITRIEWCVHACASLRGGVRQGYYCTVSSDSDYSSQKSAFLQDHY